MVIKKKNCQTDLEAFASKLFAFYLSKRLYFILTFTPYIVTQISVLSTPFKTGLLLYIFI